MRRGRPKSSDAGRRRRRLGLCAVAFALLASAAPLAAQTAERGRFEHGFPDYEPWHLPADATPEDAAALKARWQTLPEEIKTTAHAAAGTYLRYGSMRSGFLRWAPGGGFVYLYVYENFSVIDFSYGRVEVTPSELVFHVERELLNRDDARPRTLPRHWVVARWKRGSYLVPAGEMRDFGNYTAGLDEYNDFNGPCCEFAPFFSKAAGGGRSVERPAVPGKYRRFMLRPIEAKITSVGHKRTVKEYGLEGTLYSAALGEVTLRSVRIDAGRGRGMKPGLLFRVVGAPAGRFLKITRVGRSHSGGVLISNLNDKGEETCYAPDTVDNVYVACPPVAVGARVTTSPR